MRGMDAAIRSQHGSRAPAWEPDARDALRRIQQSLKGAWDLSEELTFGQEDAERPGQCVRTRSVGAMKERTPVRARHGVVLSEV
jgi:hypothetical protein